MATTSAAETFRASGRPDHGAAGARLAELFARHGATVLGLCRVLLRQREEAEDAVQQTFLSAYRSLLNGIEPRHPAAWLATIARNECWSRIEQRMREPLTEREPDSTMPDPLAAAAAKADLAELWRAIAELPRQQRNALLLREFSGLSYVEVAEALAVSQPAVESLLFRARRGLRARLRPAYGAAGCIAPLAAIREALARGIGGMPDPSTTGALAKIASGPLLAKLATGAAAVAVTGGTVAAVELPSGTHATPAGARAAEAFSAAPVPAAPAPRVSDVAAGTRVRDARPVLSRVLRKVPALRAGGSSTAAAAAVTGGASAQTTRGAPTGSASTPATDPAAPPTGESGFSSAGEDGSPSGPSGGSSGSGDASGAGSGDAPDAGSGPGTDSGSGSGTDAGVAGSGSGDESTPTDPVDESATSTAADDESTTSTDAGDEGSDSGASTGGDAGSDDSGSDDQTDGTGEGGSAGDGGEGTVAAGD